jgi:hypothetical protein
MKLMAELREIEVSGPRKLTEQEVEQGKLEMKQQQQLEDHSLQFKAWLGRNGDFDQ